MTNDNRSAAEIERDIERERAELSGTLEDLQDKFSVESIVNQVTAQFRTHGGDYTRAINESVKDNPIGLAITAVGLGWLILGSSRRKVVTAYGTDRDYADERMRRDGDVHYRPSATPSDTGSLSDTGTLQRPAATTSSTYADDFASRRTQSPSWAYAGYDPDEDDFDDEDDAFDSDGHYVGSAGSETSPSMGERASGAIDSAKEMAGEAGARLSDGMRKRRSAAQRRAASTRRRLHDGTEQLSEEARRRVVMARYKAIQARDAATRNLRRGQDQVAAFYEEQPLVVGALALAMGAAIAGALPRTRTEDKYLGEQSDSLMHEAERIYDEEREKIGNVANAAATEAKKVMDETQAELDGAAGDAADKAKSAGQRVADAARSEADRQKLGNPDA